MRMKLPLSLTFRKSLNHSLINLLDLLTFIQSLRYQKYRPMRKTIHFLKINLKLFESFKSLLKFIQCLLKIIRMNEWKTYVNVGLPTLICRVVGKADFLDLSSVLLSNYSQGCVGYEFVVMRVFLH